METHIGDMKLLPADQMQTILADLAPAPDQVARDENEKVHIQLIRLVYQSFVLSRGSFYGFAVVVTCCMLL